jgi:hypothetical protein
VASLRGNSEFCFEIRIAGFHLFTGALPAFGRKDLQKGRFLSGERVGMLSFFSPKKFEIFLS